MEELKRAVNDVSKYGSQGSPYGDSARKAIEDVCTILQSVLKGPCQEILEQHKMPHDVDTIIHYTSIGVLMSMFERLISRDNPSAKNQQVSLRLYDTIHSNDPEEGNYLYRRLKQNIGEGYDWLMKDENIFHPACITSFVFPDKISQDDTRKTEDDLVLWREYGEEGQGCSLLIPVKKENESTALLRSNLKKVFYGKDKEVQITIDKLQTFLEIVKPLADADNLKIDPEIRKYAQKRLAETFSQKLEEICYLYKSEAYEYERECRYVCLSPGKEKVFEYQDRNGSPAIRHFLEIEALDVTKLLITGSLITLGPRVPNRENVYRCISALLKEVGLEGPKVICSEILYRKS